MMYYLYILFSKKDYGLYRGYTDNLDRRFKEHQKGLVEATKDRRPLELIYYEAYRNKKDAMARERFFKTGWGRNYLKKILKHYLEEQENKK